MTIASGNRPRRGSSIQARIDFYTEKDSPEKCWDWKSSHHRQGYAILRVGSSKKYVHRLLMELIHGELPEGQVVLHLCNYTGCVNPKHLLVGTASDNFTDAQRDGLITGPFAAKFTMEQAQKIRGSSTPAPTLAKQLGVNRQTISNIRDGKTYTKEHSLIRMREHGQS